LALSTFACRIDMASSAVLGEFVCVGSLGLYTSSDLPKPAPRLESRSCDLPGSGLPLFTGALPAHALGTPPKSGRFRGSVISS